MSAGGGVGIAVEKDVKATSLSCEWKPQQKLSEPLIHMIIPLLIHSSWRAQIVAGILSMVSLPLPGSFPDCFRQH